MVSRATFLFSMPSTLDGMAEIFNVPGNNHVQYSTSRSGAEADRRALTQDWAAYADEMRMAAKRVATR